VKAELTTDEVEKLQYENEAVAAFNAALDSMKAENTGDAQSRSHAL